MNPKILIFIGFAFASLACTGIAVILPSDPIYVLFKIILIALAVLLDIFAFASRYYTYLLLPFLRQRSRSVIINDQVPYWFSSTNDCIVRKMGDDFVATVYMSIPIFVSASELSDEDKLLFTMQISRLVGISREPVRFTTELYLMNKDEYIKKLSDSINIAEDELLRLKNSNGTEGEIEHIKGKLTMWKKVYDNITKVVSYELTSFATVSSKGTKEFEAISIAMQRARELMAGVATTLGVAPVILTGEDILKYVEPENLIPYSTIRKQISSNIERGVS